MKSAIALAAVAGLATVASAQSLDVELSFDKTSIAIGETAVATITATLNGLGASAYFSSVTADLTASSNAVSASAASGLDWANGALGAVEAGSDDGAGGLSNIFGAQSTFLPPTDASNPFVVLSFVVTGVAEGVVSYSAAGSAASQAPGAFSYTDPTTNPFAAPVYSDAMNSASLVVTPAPSAMALLGLGGLVAGRRRR